MSGFQVTPSTFQVNEGESLTTALSGFTPGSTLYFKVTGRGVSKKDFAAGVVKGRVQMDANGVASIAHTLRADKTTEGAESFTIQVFSDKKMRNRVGESGAVGIGDTSVRASKGSSTPPSPSNPVPLPDPLTNAWTYDGHTYQLIKEGRDWEAARKDAITRGGYLAEIDSSSENSFVFESILYRGGLETPTVRDGGGARYVWLGASDISEEGIFVWSRSLKLIAGSYQNWGTGRLGSEPDNFNNQDALAIGLENWPKGVSPGQGFGDAGKWNDINTANQIFYLIEYDDILPIA